MGRVVVVGAVFCFWSICAATGSLAEYKGKEDDWLEEVRVDERGRDCWELLEYKGCCWPAWLKVPELDEIGAREPEE